jgi:hypothetical protein
MLMFGAKDELDIQSWRLDRSPSFGLLPAPDLARYLDRRSIADGDPIADYVGAELRSFSRLEPSRCPQRRSS